MSKEAAQLDFFEERKEEKTKKKTFERRSSFRDLIVPDIQSKISRLDPNLLKSLIVPKDANILAEKSPESPFQKDQKIHSPLPPLNRMSRSIPENSPGASPLTIFYNGTVAVFDVPQYKAEKIIELAQKGIAANFVSDDKIERPEQLEKIEGDLPIARKKSLQRFIEKRKERFSSFSPYRCSSEHGNKKQMVPIPFQNFTSM